MPIIRYVGGCILATRILAPARCLATECAAATRLTPSHFALVPYGVLGTRLTADRKVVDVGGPPRGIAFVDPAGLPFIQQLGPSGAGGAAGAIYRFLGIDSQPCFPAEVMASVTQVGAAKGHEYALPGGGTAHCIHVVGPNFQQTPESHTTDPTLRSACVEELATAYVSVLTEFAASDMQTLRLLPISGGIFAGPFQKDVARLSYEAIERACERLPPEVAATVAGERTIEYCLFAEDEWASFVGAGFAPGYQ